MKQFKNLVALVLALVMVLSVVGAALAEDPPAGSTPTTNRTYDSSISVSGLESGDTVNFYQVLKWDVTATATGGWVPATGFTSLTNTQIQKMLALDSTGKAVAITDANRDQYGIDATLAGTISVLAQAQGVTATFADVAESNGTASHAISSINEAGLYIALVNPGTAEYLYNPVFVGADFDSENSTYTHAAVMTTSYSPAALAKKEKVELTKEVTSTANGTAEAGSTAGDTKYDVDIGDTIEFTITSKVPAYSTAYQNPTYVITDTLESGLEIQGQPTVTIAGLTGTNALASGDYAVVVADTNRSFTVTMNQSGLTKVANTGTAQEIKVVYNAKITSLENATVTEKENEATVKFSNNPDDSTSYSLLEDKTRNYTFSIDANLLGYTGGSYETDELIKIGLKADGSPITATKKYHHETEWTPLSPLAGATFGLYTDSTCNTLYTNTVFNGNVVSDANGRLNITGLDCGTYYLKELTAPDGYVKDNRTFMITIAATYNTISGGTYQKNVGTEANPELVTVKYGSYEVLKGYTVSVNDGTNTVTSTYDIVNKGPEDHKVVDKATYIAMSGEGEGDWAGDNVTPISNTQGAALPATGGIGTTIIYVAGIVLVLGAAAVILARRKAEQE